MAVGTNRSRLWTSAAVAALLVQAVLAGPSVQPLQGLVQRLLPASYHNAFDFQVVPQITPPNPENKYDVYRVSNKAANNTAGASRILIEGTSLSALGAGLKYYLDQAGQVELTWSGNRFDELPSTPPRVPDQELDTKKVVTNGHVRGSFVPWRYYTNVVSFGYQFVFWDWQRWEREIDWMLLNGINMLPAMVGQEYVTRELYRSLNLTDAEIDNFLSGPAYMPWQRMGNIQGSWNYKLTHTSAANELIYKNKWIDSQWALQQLILSRLRAFGITAVFPAFQSFVPRTLPSKFPQNQFGNSSLWSAFPEEYTEVTYVHQTDPLFATLTADYLKLQQKLNGNYTSHFYILDLYNDLIPDCQIPSCYTDITTSVTNALHSVDPQATWVMQGWFLQNPAVWTPENTKVYFAGIRAANGTPFIYDLAADALPTWTTTEGFYGYDWGWSVLNNYGASQGLFGRVNLTLTAPFEVYQQYTANLKGLGVTAEGINNNEYVYALTLDLAWHDPTQVIDGPDHLARFIRRRYGVKGATPLAQSAWSRLSKTVWNHEMQPFTVSKSYLEKTPALNMTDPGWLGTVVDYDKSIVVQAAKDLVQSALQESHGDVSDAFVFDLVDVTREVLLSTVIPALHQNLVDGYQAGDVKKIKTVGRQIVELIKDADTLLNTHELFSFGAFVKDAKDSIDPIGNQPSISFASSTAGANKPTKAGYQQFLESNARDIVTWWGPDGTPSPGSLQDYASKQWGGLINSYYLPRWQLFINQLEQAAASKKAWDDVDYGAKKLAIETEWQAQTWGARKGETWVTNGQNPVEVVRELWDRWGALAVKIANTGKA